jgi:prophage DNA circulation protein
MDNIFESEFDVQSQNDELNKALEAGYGTNAADYTQGRALQREDLEATLVTVLDVKQKDLKLFHKLHKEPVASTVHQVNRQTDVGGDEFLFVDENEKASAGDPQLQRKIYNL